LLVDEHQLIHEVMRGVIARAIHPEEILVATGIAEATKLMSELRALGLVIMDLRYQGFCSVSVFSEIRQKFPGPRYVVLTEASDRETVARVLEAGAHGYLTKATPITVIEAALKLVAAGGTYAPPEIFNTRAVRSGKKAPSRLDVTARQLEVLRLLSEGRPNRDIAKALQISESTVKQHIRGIFQALNVSTRTEALVALARQGIRFD
jgi:DNA-binding NarL/FixJ family response regulator